MAAVHFVITIPTEKEEFRLRAGILPKNQVPTNGTSPSLQSSSNPSNSVVCTANLFAQATAGVQYGTFPAKMKSETTNKHGGDNEANSINTLDVEAGVNQPSMQKSWEALRDLLSSTHWAAHKKKDNSHDLNLPPDTCMEIVLRQLLQIYRIDNAAWTMDIDGRMLKVTFTMELNEDYENISQKLLEWRIGECLGTTVSVMSCISFMTSPKQNRDEDDLNEPNINLEKESIWDRFMNSVRSRLNVAQIVRDVRQEASITFDFIVLVVSAAILASFGLVEDSSIFLASSMLISPLMGPIIAAIFGTVIKDTSLTTLGLVNELLGILMATFVGFIFGLVVCSIDNRYGIGEGLTTEMISRCELRSLVVGIFTALASGAAAAVGILAGNIGSLVGVAISASLLPPAVNSGLLWALAFLYKFYETDKTRYNSVVKTSLYSDHQATELAVLGLISICLTISNVVCVYLMGIIVLKIKEIAPVISRNNRHFWKHDIKIARDLNRNGLDADTTVINDFAAIPKENQRSFGLNCDFFHNNYLGKLSYQNTWSPNGYCPVPDLEGIYSNFPKHSTHTLKHNDKLSIMRRLKSRSVDLGQYLTLTQNTTPRARTAVDVEPISSMSHPGMQSEIVASKPSGRKRRNFVVTPALDNCFVTT